MKRDMDLVREILIQFESSGQNVISRLDMARLLGASDGVSLHLELMEQAGLVKSHFTKPNPEFLALYHSGYSLTWAGHDFLDSVRDPEIWTKTKDGARAAGGFTFELLGEIAKGLIKTQIKRHAGIEI